MSRVIIFSRTFPSYHPRKGELTEFPEKIMAGFADILSDYKIPDEMVLWEWYAYYNSVPKWHTIRAGNRWKVGDKFSPRVWSGKPYRSKQILIGPDIEVRKVWSVHFYGMTKYVGDNIVNDDELNKVALNDGLSFKDFNDWFNKFPFHGQIISWANHINY